MSNSSFDINTIRAKPAVKKVDGRASLQNLLQKDIRFGRQGLPDKIKESFYHELCILLEAGVDIRTALELATEQKLKKKYVQVFKLLREKIIEGETLSAAMNSSGQFTPYEYYSVQIGEETGKMVLVLKELAVYYHKKIDQRRQIISAITYPVVILGVAFCAVSFMIAYVVPMFADVLKRTGGELPFITKMVLSASHFLKSSMGIAGFGILAATVFFITQREKNWFRSLSSKLLLKTPVVGPIISKIYLTRFSNTLCLLLSSSIPLMQSIELIKKMIGFYPIEECLDSIVSDIIKGKSLNESMGVHNIFPSKMVLLIKVGEEVNQVDIFLQKIAEQYSNDVEHQANMLGKLLEPIIIIMLGIVIGIILIAMYLPLFKLGNSF